MTIHTLYGLLFVCVGWGSVAALPGSGSGSGIKGSVMVRSFVLPVVTEAQKEVEYDIPAGMTA